MPKGKGHFARGVKLLKHSYEDSERSWDKFNGIDQKSEQFTKYLEAWNKLDERQRTELTVSEANHLIGKQQPTVIPLRIKHGFGKHPDDHVDVGTATLSRYDPETGDCEAEYEIDESIPASINAIACIEQLGWRGLSLGHNAFTGVPTELSICAVPARDGCYITEFNGRNYKGQDKRINQNQQQQQQQTFGQVMASRDVPTNGATPQVPVHAGVPGLQGVPGLAPNAPTGAAPSTPAAGSLQPQPTNNKNDGNAMDTGTDGDELSEDAVHLKAMSTMNEKQKAAYQAKVIKREKEQSMLRKKLESSEKELEKARRQSYDTARTTLEILRDLAKAGNYVDPESQAAIQDPSMQETNFLKSELGRGLVMAAKEFIELKKAGAVVVPPQQQQQQQQQTQLNQQDLSFFRELALYREDNNDYPTLSAPVSSSASRTGQINASAPSMMMPMMPQQLQPLTRESLLETQYNSKFGAVPGFQPHVPMGMQYQQQQPSFQQMGQVNASGSSYHPPQSQSMFGGGNSQYVPTAPLEGTKDPHMGSVLARLMSTKVTSNQVMPPKDNGMGYEDEAYPGGGGGGGGKRRRGF
jgi:hypothetical protein